MSNRKEAFLLDARLNFLEESARLLHTAAPTTSAYLMRERNDAASVNEKSPSKAQLKDTCRACGAISVRCPTLEPTVIEPRPVSKGRTNEDIVPQSPSAEKQMRIECLACHRFDIPPSTISQQERRGSSTKANRSTHGVDGSVMATEPQPESATSHVDKPASANANSKKRAKARKQGGLQALLEKSKEVERNSADPGLDLMDFMKKT